MFCTYEYRKRNIIFWYVSSFYDILKGKLRNQKLQFKNIRLIVFVIYSKDFSFLKIQNSISSIHPCENSRCFNLLTPTVFLRPVNLGIRQRQHIRNGLTHASCFSICPMCSTLLRHTIELGPVCSILFSDQVELLIL